MEKVVQDFGILIHGGAGNQTLANRSSNRTKDIRRSLELAVSLGYDSLTNI
jgi:hypothetical protein